MIVTDVHIHHVRNIHEMRITLNPRFTLLLGKNGSGKTAFLEALYCLGRGRSFRSGEISTMITRGESQLTVFARTADNSTISIQKASGQPTRVKINQIACTNTSQLAYALPMQVFYKDLFEIMDAGSSVRRTLLDWGLFHVKPHYLSLWKDYKRTLQQRNVLLKQQASPHMLSPWNKQLSDLAYAIDALRQEYFIIWQQQFISCLSELSDLTCTLDYYKGWDRKNSGICLENLLQDHYASDLQRQYTQLGPHQADVLIKTKDCQARHIFSRGEQKIVLTALRLAQSDLLEHAGICLLDDYPAELDERYQERLLRLLMDRKGQYVITSSIEIPCFDLLSPQHLTRYQLVAGTLT